MHTRLPLAVAVIVSLGADALAQQQTDRRSRDEPEIIVEAGGRVGPCDVLRFTPDGNFLLAGGDDKVVRMWQHSASGLETDRTRVQALRWRAWREQRGGIKTLAISPDGKHVAVGGYGMKPSTVTVLGLETGDTLALSWPVSRRGEANYGTVMAITFDDRGRVAFGTSDGSLWLWEPVKLKEPDKDGRLSQPPVRVGKFDELRDPDGTAEFNFPRLVHFRDRDTLLAVAQSGDVVECDLTGVNKDAVNKPPPVKKLFNVNDKQTASYRLYRAELIDGGKWLLLASVGPQVLLRSLDGKESVVLPLAKDQFPRSIAWQPQSRQVAVGVGAALASDKKPRFYLDGPEQILIFDDPIKSSNTKPKAIPHMGRAEALTFHPTMPRLAIAGGDADQVTLLSLQDGVKTVTDARGAGRRIAAVNLSTNGSTVGVQVEADPKSNNPNVRGTGLWTRFDLSRLKPTQDTSQEWVGPVEQANGWIIEPSADRFVWFAKRERDGLTLRLATDRHRDGAPTCFTFLPSTGDAPPRVIIGHYYGCSLFELVPGRAEKGAIVASRVFTGHAGEVTSVVTAADQTWFVTGGTDHTVSAWSLRDWKSEGNLGASFAVRDGSPVVAAVDAGSPAWEAGLRPGDQLDLLAVNGSLIFDRRPGKEKVGTTEDALAELKSPRARIELYFGIAAAEKTERRETLTTVRQRPMWKWFPAFDTEQRMNDWVVWMWHGSYYHTKTANGDRLVGWHVNAPDAGDRPRYYQLQQFEKIFHRPEVLETLMETRDVGAALVKARGDNPTLVSFTQFEPAPVSLALKRTRLQDEALPLTIQVQARGNNPDLLPERVELWLNDHMLDSWPKPGTTLNGKEAFEAALTIPPEKFRTGENHLAVLSFNTAGGRAEEARIIQNITKRSDSNLHALLAGINDYSGHRKNAAGTRSFGDLKSAAADATALGKSLTPFAGPERFYTQANVVLRLEREAARNKLLASLKAIAGRAKPDDLLVLFFAGHGDLLMPKDAELPKSGGAILGGEGVFYLCCPDYSPSKPDETAISVDELFAALAKINCRKLVLLDACHSGRAAAPNVIRRCVPNGQGPLVIAACDQSEQSYEDPRYGHGLFTYALISALDKERDFRKADYNSDGALSAEELYEYLAVRVPALLKQTGKKDAAQSPICFPRQLPKEPIFVK